MGLIQKCATNQKFLAPNACVFNSQILSFFFFVPKLVNSPGCFCLESISLSSSLGLWALPLRRARNIISPRRDTMLKRFFVPSYSFVVFKIEWHVSSSVFKVRAATPCLSSLFFSFCLLARIWEIFLLSLPRFHTINGFRNQSEWVFCGLVLLSIHYKTQLGLLQILEANTAQASGCFLSYRQFPKTTNIWKLFILSSPTLLVTAVDYIVCYYDSYCRPCRTCWLPQLPVLRI